MNLNTIIKQEYKILKQAPIYNQLLFTINFSYKLNFYNCTQKSLTQNNKPKYSNKQIGMEDQNQSQKKFEIIEEWHRQRPEQKVYKIHMYMTSNMLKAEQKLRQKFQAQYNQTNNQNNMNARLNNNIEEEESQLMSQQSSNATQASFSLQRPHQPNQNPQKPIKIYENFKNRGKYDNLKYSFSRQKQLLTIIISQKYFIHELKSKQIDLLMVYQSFIKIWQDQYLIVMQSFIKYSKQFKPNEIIKFQFVAIDILGVTFDISYHNKDNNKANDKIIQFKRFRFRYSPYEFRQNPFFQQKNTEQMMSFFQINQANINNINYNDFYTTMRLGFIDDINNNSNDLYKRMIIRFWVFYQLHGLNRGITQYQQFNKKALGRVHFHSVRMKKFQLIFPFPLLHRNTIQYQQQSILYITFSLNDKQTILGQNGLQFKMEGNIVQHHRILTFQQKRQIMDRLKKQDLYEIVQKQNINHNQLYEFTIKLKFDDRISRAFAKIQTIVSFFLDKISYNNILNKPIPKQLPGQIQTQKIIQIYSKPIYFQQNQYKHTHELILQLMHKHSTQQYYNNAYRYVDEIHFVKLTKKKRKFNTKQKKQQSKQQQFQLIINDQLKKYINQLIKNKPLRQCHTQIMDYIMKVVKIIYEPFKDKNVIQKYNNRQIVLNLIITNILKLLQLGSNHSRKSQVIIITQNDPLFMKAQNQTDLIAQITFNIKDLKVYWIKRLPQGYIIIRMFQKYIEVVKDINASTIIQIDFVNVQKSGQQLLKQLRNILTKQFATLQNMMV